MFPNGISSDVFKGMREKFYLRKLFVNHLNLADIDRTNMIRLIACWNTKGNRCCVNSHWSFQRFPVLSTFTFFVRRCVLSSHRPVVVTPNLSSDNACWSRGFNQ